MGPNPCEPFSRPYSPPGGGATGPWDLPGRQLPTKNLVLHQSVAGLHSRACRGLAQGPGSPGRGGGRYTRERLARGVTVPWAFPRRVLPDGPPTLGARLCPLRRSSESLYYKSIRVICTDFHRFLPIRSTRVFSQWLLLTQPHVFFSGFVLQRNGYIKRVALVEESSILLLLRWLEASE